MTRLRVGTRGSELALIQTRSVCTLLSKAHPSLTFEEVVIKTEGDVASTQLLAPGFPVGGFTSAIEQALIDKKIDFAVHSYKDLPTASPDELLIAAVPPRDLAHDVIIPRKSLDLNNLPKGLKIGTGSPRRSAQWKRMGPVTIVPIRGNVLTRLRKLDDGEIDAVVLAAAGLNRLGIKPQYAIDLLDDHFLPAPAQGALTVQTRTDSKYMTLLESIDHKPSRLIVNCERAFLKTIDAGCHQAVAALAAIDETTTNEVTIKLKGQLFSDDTTRLAQGVARGVDPKVLGQNLADQLIKQLGGQTP